MFLKNQALQFPVIYPRFQIRIACKIAERKTGNMATRQSTLIGHQRPDIIPVASRAPVHWLFRLRM